MNEQPAGVIMTVLGPVSPADVGVALMHEHVFIDLDATFAPTSDSALAPYQTAPVSEDLLDLLRIWPFSLTPDNGRLDDEDLAVEELATFVANGGSLLVDCTLEGIGRNPTALERVAKATGLHIVQGTGYYVELAHPPRVAALSCEELAAEFVCELTQGIAETGIRAGIIGEIGVSGIDPLSREKRGDITQAEEKVLRAAARASLETGAAVTVHLDPRSPGAFTATAILFSEGVAPERVIMDHLDARPDLDYHLRVAETGVFLEYDHFGREYYAGHMGMPYTQDAVRIELLCTLLERGYVNQLLLSQDVCAKIDLHRFGGNGYDHLLARVVPELRARGIGDDTLYTLLVENPRRALAFGSVAPSPVM